MAVTLTTKTSAIAFDDNPERASLVAAARRVIQRSGYTEAHITEILKEARVSTRAFYRHFSSKDDVLVAVAEQERRSLERRVRLAVESAADPLAAVDAWIESLLALAFEPRLLKSVLIFRSPVVQSVIAFHEEIWSPDELVRFLATALESAADRSLVIVTSPESDAYSIFDVVYNLVLRLTDQRLRMSRTEARRHIDAFCVHKLAPPAVAPSLRD